MNRRRDWILILGAILLMITATELVRGNLLSASMFGSFFISAALMGINLPRYQTRKEANVRNMAFLTLAIGLIMYVILVIVQLQASETDLVPVTP